MQILSKFYHNKHLTHSSFAPVTPLWQFCPLALFYPSQCTNALLFNSATSIFLKQVVIYKNIIINSKANKYQQNYKQTILPWNFINFLKT